MPLSPALAFLALAAGQPGLPPSPLDVGPAIGERIPPFEAPDQSGRLRKFEDLRGANGLMLVFFRSADW